MAGENKKKETVLWDALDNRSKSYSVKLLHFWWYRNKMIHKSWTREEVLDWELIRALDVLPREYYLKDFLLLINERAPMLSEPIKGLVKEPEKVQIVSFPKMYSKGNSASDIEFKSGDSVLWLEAKTDPKYVDENQIKEQKKTLSEKRGVKSGLVLLIPTDYPNKKEPHITWPEVARCFERVNARLREDFKGNKIIRGYIDISNELINRIDSWSPHL